MTIKPELSVNVVCLNGPDVLIDCLDALVPQGQPGKAEILAVGHWNEEEGYATLCARYPGVIWLTAAASENVPQMRTRGLRASRGQIVALLEDDCVVGHDWCAAVIDAHSDPCAAIGGPIAPGENYGLLDWAVYFSEYARFMPPFAGAVQALPGNNVSYKRAALADTDDGQGFYEILFHQRLGRSGHALQADPRLVVTNVNHWSRTHLTWIPFEHGRAFAGLRAAGFSRGKRSLYAGLAPGLPVLKTARVARQVASRKRYVKEFLFSLPLTILFMLSWSLGEFWGYLFGPGDSLGRWRSHRHRSCE